jgi:uncharacterized protein (DUF1501 family)
MDTVTRRRFLVTSGVVGGTALAAGATTLGWQALGDPSLLDRLTGDDQPSGRTLVLVTLYGGNDGLATVIPAGDPAYKKARPELAYDEGDVLDLGDGLGLNPEMKGLHKLWQDKKLAIVRGVGYPSPDHSHFRSMAIWQSAAPKSAVPTGWLGRWLDSVSDDDPLTAISVGPTLPPLLAGAKRAGAALPLTGFQLPGVLGGKTGGSAGSTDAAVRLSKAVDGEPELTTAARKALADLLAADAQMEKVTEQGEDPNEQDDDKADGASAGGQKALDAQLALVARCMRAKLPTKVYSVSLGGFDLHANEKSLQSSLLGDVDKAVSGFLSDVADAPGGDGVVVAVYSEFGRRVAANASAGTDHGTAGPMFVAGKPVKGGFYGDQPSLTDLDDGDLKTTTDFRDVYATLLDGVLGSDPGRVLAGWKNTVPLL